MLLLGSSFVSVTLLFAVTVKLCVKGVSYNKSRGGLQNRKVESSTKYKTLED